jgi:hypothetical protein
MGDRTQDSNTREHLEGRYSNYFEIGHNAFEFLMDFGQLYCETAGGNMHTRIVTIPEYARKLVEVLNRSLSEYERTHGRVSTETDPDQARKANIRHIHSIKKP